MAALKVHRGEFETPGEEILAACADRIRLATAKAASDFNDYLDQVGPALNEAHTVHQRAGGPKSHWSKWLASHTQFSKSQANRLIKWHARKELARVRAGSFLPQNAEQWTATEGVADEQLPAVLERVGDAVERGSKATSALIKSCAKEVRRPAPNSTVGRILKAVSVDGGATVAVLQAITGLYHTRVSDLRKYGFNIVKQGDRYILKGGKPSMQSPVQRVTKAFGKLSDRDRRTAFKKIEADPVISADRFKRAQRIVPDGTLVECATALCYAVLDNMNALMTNHGPEANKRWLAKASSEEIQDMVSAVSRAKSDLDRFLQFLQKERERVYNRRKN